MPQDYRERTRPDERRYPNGERMPEDAPSSFEEPALRPSKKKCSNDNVWAAVVLMTVGTIFFLGNFGLIRFHNIWQFWPLALVVAGLNKYSKDHGASVASIGLIVAGVLVLLGEFGLFPFSVWTLWPLVLIGVGVAMISKPWGKFGSLPFLSGASSAEHFQDSDNRLHEWTLFGGVKRIVNSPDFQGGQLVSIFGGIEIDLRRAQIVPRDKPVIIEANTSFGGVSIKVPDTWRVAVRGVGIFGGYVDETIRSQYPNPLAPLLVVTGYAAFGGVVVE